MRGKRFRLIGFYRLGQAGGCIRLETFLRVSLVGFLANGLTGCYDVETPVFCSIIDVEVEKVLFWDIKQQRLSFPRTQWSQLVNVEKFQHMKKSLKIALRRKIHTKKNLV
ncbi:unnamed protein product [Larinioides sclopetarius]|uniref:Uncharacterized protein n=1 Tax=Larinioides sclopetarius TaxID=280406 RepID=A0AAV2BQJ0_9ARAC